jgi:hypothetical protein
MVETCRKHCPQWNIFLVQVPTRLTSKPTRCERLCAVRRGRTEAFAPMAAVQR